jgi:hypothetical protein
MNEHITNLTEAEAKLMLQFAMEDLRSAIYDPHARYDAACIAWLTQTIEKLSKENTTQS